MNPRIMIVFALAALPAACGQINTDTVFEPYARDGTWVVEGANQSNIAAQLMDPADLIAGRSEKSPHYRQATTAVTTLWTNKPTQTLAPGLKGGDGAAAAAPAAAP